MFDSVAVEVVIGLALVFFLIATVASGVNQVLSRWLDTRAKTLWRALEKILETPPSPSGSGAATSAAVSTGADVGVITSLSFGFGMNDSRPTGSGAGVDGANRKRFVEELLETPSLRSLDPVRESGKPTKIDEIPPRVFAMALLELAKLKGSDDGDSIQKKLELLAAAYPNSPVGTFLSTIAGSIGNDLDRYIDTVGVWFDEQMVRLTATYRKNTKWVLLIIGAVAAVVFNVDAIEVGTTLRDDSNVRAGVLVLADDIGNDAANGEDTGSAGTDGGVTSDCSVEPSDPDRELKCAREVLRTLNGLRLPVLGDWNWDSWKASWSEGWFSHLIGLALSAGAVSLGAPFWFDVLKWLAGRRRGAAN